MSKEDYEETKTTNFGFDKVTEKEKSALINKVFSDIAPKYDFMNDLLSFGAHRLWKDEFCRMVPNLDSLILDVAGGTGDIAFRLKKRAKEQGKNPHLIICDINADMLKVCMDKAVDNNILSNFDIVACDSGKLPFPDNSFDYYTIAFGIRNTLCINRTLEEAYRVLKPTGKFLCLEFSKVQNDFIRPFYDFYSFNFIPNLGQAFANNRSAYRYLAESISLFPDQEDFKSMIQNIGFKDTGYKNLTFGIAAIHYGYK